MIGSHRLIPAITAPRIKRAVKALARAISKDYLGKEPVVVCILKGSFIFCADLIREITIPVKIDFIGMKSYGAATRSSGVVHVTKDLEVDIRGKDVIVVEDIVDTGGTMKHILNLLKEKRPATVKVCALVDKRKTWVRPSVDYLGFRQGRAFLVGYGLDIGERYRQLKGLYRIGEGRKPSLRKIG